MTLWVASRLNNGMRDDRAGYEDKVTGPTAVDPDGASRQLPVQLIQRFLEPVGVGAFRLG
jgi:hypothetical protein